MTDTARHLTRWQDMSSEELREAAKAVVRPRDPHTHWTALATIVGTVEDKRLYDEFGYASTRAWSEEELDLSHDDAFEALKLWRLMAEGLTATPPVDLIEWGQLAKGRALLVARAVKMGGAIRAWFERALAAENEEELRAALKQAMGEDVWVRLDFDVPAETAQLLEAAMMLALREVFPGEAMTLAEVQAAIYRRETAHRCLEVLAAHYVGDRATP